MDFRPPDFQRTLANVARELASRSIPAMTIGGQAVLLHGQPRLTQDIDITLGVAPDQLDALLDVCSACGLTPLPEHPAQFVRETYVLPALENGTHVRVDFIFSTTPYEAQAIERAVRVDVLGQAVAFAAAEDLILHKLFAGRPRDLEDARGIVRRKGPELDWAYLEWWVAQFAIVPGREEMPTQLQQLRDDM